MHHCLIDRTSLPSFERFYGKPGLPLLRLTTSINWVSTEMIALILQFYPAINYRYLGAMRNTALTKRQNLGFCPARHCSH